jgi:hypothetical protein
MERYPNQTPIPGSGDSGSAPEQQILSDSLSDRKDGSSPSDEYPATQPASPASQKQQQQPVHRYQHPDAPPPRWARALVRLILESSAS